MHLFGSIFLLLILVGVLAAPLLIGARGSGWAQAAWVRVARPFGLDTWPKAVVVPAVALWGAVALLFLTGLFWLPVFLWRHDFAAAEDPGWDLRWTFITLAAVTAALSAVIALPFTLLRTRYSSRQTDAEEEGLLTDRINKAVEGLGAEKEVNRLGRNIHSTHEDEKRNAFQWDGDPDPVPEGATDRKNGDWANIALTQPNLEVRIGAIYALERIAQRNVEEVHVQIMEILCAYIRENAPAKDDPDEPEDWLKESEDDGPLEDGREEGRKAYKAELRNWLERAKPRTDIRVALEVIGRRSDSQCLAEARYGAAPPDATFVFDEAPDETPAEAEGEDDAADLRRRVDAWKERAGRYAGYRLDLRGADLRGADLSPLNLVGADLREARLQGADLWGARLQGANLWGARLQGAVLGKARLQGADLWEARLQGAVLWEARLQGADLGEITVDGETHLTAASYRASAVRLTDFTECTVEPRFFEEAFGDGSIKGLPEGYFAGEPPLAHWAREELEDEDFFAKWHAWQVEIGYRAPDAAD
jgi:hypothetical protein